MMPPILQDAEQLIAKGVDWPLSFARLLTLTPQALSVTIPMALLLGVLFGLGRLSADREFVAMQACGVSIFRLMRPLRCSPSWRPRRPPTKPSWRCRTRIRPFAR